MTFQIPFQLPYAVPKTVDDFYVSTSNEEAFSWVQKEGWPFPILLVCGPEGSGKTHMAHVFSKHVFKAKDLKEEDIPLLPSRVAIEDIDEVRDETIIFHLYNYTKENQKQVLLTTRSVPLFKLADLKTRINSLPVVYIHAPDDSLMMALLCKSFMERQVEVDSEVISYLMTHLERSYRAIHQLVMAVDTYSLSLKRRITIPLIKDALKKMEKETLF